MIVRRFPMLVLSIVVVVALVLTARTTVEPTQAVFSNVATPWMPAAPLPGGLTSTWFCPGVPASGEDETGGVVRVFNTGDAEMGGRLTVLTVEGDPVTQPVQVAAYGVQEFDLDALVDSPYAAAFVEIDGGGGLVEQLAKHPAGFSVAACANAPSSEWYLATGDTLEESSNLLVLSNPNDDDAIVDIELSTSAGVRQPQNLQNYPVPGRSVRIVDVNDVRADETEVSVSVEATRGTVVVGRAQVFRQEARRGYVMSLAAPTLGEQWWFANGPRGEDYDVKYTLYNPNDFDVEVTPVLLGFLAGSDYVPPDLTVTVPDGERVVWDPNEVADVPDGVVSAVFGTLPGEGIVVERVVTRTIDGIPTTSTTLGAIPRSDNYLANTWYVGIGAESSTSYQLVVFNANATDATVTIQAVHRSGGVETVPSLEAVDLPASQVITIEIDDPAALDVPLVVRSTTQIFVERVLPREPDAQGRVSVWAVPANA